MSSTETPQPAENQTLLDDVVQLARRHNLTGFGFVSFLYDDDQGVIAQNQVFGLSDEASKKLHIALTASALLAWDSKRLAASTDEYRRQQLARLQAETPRDPAN